MQLHQLTPPPLEATIAAELAAHRPELEALVRDRVYHALAELTRELVEAELTARSNGAGENLGTADVFRAEPTSKRCSVCGETKPLAEFYRDVRRRDGHRSQCKQCIADARTQSEAQPVPFAGTQSPTSHENTAVRS